MNIATAVLRRLTPPPPPPRPRYRRFAPAPPAAARVEIIRRRIVRAGKNPATADTMEEGSSCDSHTDR